MLVIMFSSEVRGCRVLLGNWQSDKDLVVGAKFSSFLSRAKSLLLHVL